MRPQIVSHSGGAGSSDPVVFDHLRNPFNISIGCVVSGTISYTIQHTFDWDYNTNGLPASPTWFNHDNADLVAATGNANDNYAFPCTAAKILQNSGTGSVTVTFIQAGLAGGRAKGGPRTGDPETHDCADGRRHRQ